MSVAALSPPLLGWLSARVDGLRRVALRDFDGMGCGVAAAEALRAGACVLRVPRACWEPFGADAARAAAPSAAARVDAVAASMGAGSALADSVLLAAALVRQKRRPTPDDAPFVDSLPASLDVPLLWPAELQQALLAGTSCESTCAQQAALSQVMHAALRDGDGDDGAGPSLEELRWGQSLILSRAHSGRGKPLALVPGLDLLNTGGHAAPTAEVAFADDGAFELVATRDHAPGEQLLIDYSTPTPHRMLRLYGFVPARGDGGGAATEEALLPLLPADGDGGAAAAARALEAAGLGRTVALRWADDGRSAVALPVPGAGAPRSDAERNALLVLGAALERQEARQRHGAAACAAVMDHAGVDAAARRRAAAAADLHAAEAPLLRGASDAVAARMRG